MKVLVYRKCSTCMKALKWLDEHNINYEERAIKEENPTYEELKKWYAKSGLPLKKFLNTGGMIYIILLPKSVRLMICLLFAPWASVAKLWRQ